MARHSPWFYVLETFRAAEPDEPLLFVRQDREMRRALAAWRMMAAAERPNDMAEVANTWEGLWDGVKVDFTRFADLLSTYEGHARHLFERARALRLIYPDGAVHAKALKIVLQDAAPPKEEADDD